MSEPISLAAATLLLSGASTAAGVVGQMQQQKAQQSAANRQRDAEMQAYRDNIVASNTKMVQEGQAATEKADRAALEARKAKATAITSAGEAGVSGMTVDALLRDISGQGLENVSAVEANYLRQREADIYERDNLRNSTISGLNSIKPATSPDYLGAALKIGSSYGQYRKDTGATSLY